MSLRPTIRRAAREQNFAFVLAGLMLILVASPILQASGGGPPERFAVELAFTVLMLLGVWSLDVSVRGAGVLLAVTSLATGLIAILTHRPELLIVNLALVAVFCLMSIVVGMRQVLAGGPITRNHLMGAMCVYLLLGVLWGILFGLTYAIAPDWFRVSSPIDRLQIGEFLYFSFVTLTTVGYGDVTPAHPLVKTAAYLEAVTGQLYIAVLIASLVGRRTGRSE